MITMNEFVIKYSIHSASPKNCASFMTYGENGQRSHASPKNLPKICFISETAGHKNSMTRLELIKLTTTTTTTTTAVPPTKMLSDSNMGRGRQKIPKKSQISSPGCHSMCHKTTIKSVACNPLQAQKMTSSNNFQMKIRRREKNTPSIKQV